MRANIKHVIDAFLAGRPSIGDSKRTCRTDGLVIYSYAMPIACRCTGPVYICCYSDAPSATTRSQIRACQAAMPFALAASAANIRRMADGLDMLPDPEPPKPYPSTLFDY